MFFLCGSCRPAGHPLDTSVFFCSTRGFAGGRGNKWGRKKKKKVLLRWYVCERTKMVNCKCACPLIPALPCVFFSPRSPRTRTTPAARVALHCGSPRALHWPFPTVGVGGRRQRGRRKEGVLRWLAAHYCAYPVGGGKGPIVGMWRAGFRQMEVLQGRLRVYCTQVRRKSQLDGTHT